jgi:hypothetical protein
MFRFSQSISVFAHALAGINAGAVMRAQTVTPPAQVTVTSGVVGIAEGQSAQLNALNPGVAGPAAAGEICSGLLTFLGDHGKVLKSATVNVAPGTSGHLVIDSDKDLALAVDVRKEIRATIAIPPVPAPAASSTFP